MCTVGAFRCIGADTTQLCSLDEMGCPDWFGSTWCCPGIGCDVFTGSCEGVNDFACGDKPGTYCQTASASLVVDCAVVPPGLIKVVRRYACPAGQTCNAGINLPLGSVCGCPPVEDKVGGGCEVLKQAIALPCHAHRRCDMVGACQVWTFQSSDL